MDVFHGSLHGIGKLRNEVMDFLYTHAQREQTRRQMKASMEWKF